MKENRVFIPQCYIINTSERLPIINL